jgi:collagen triple helix repeat protein
MLSAAVMASASNAKSVTSVTKKHTNKCKMVRIKMKNGKLSPWRCVGAKPKPKVAFSGVTGATGTQGSTGAQGVKGDTGSAGNNGVNGTFGAKGDQGIQGATRSRWPRLSR